MTMEPPSLRNRHRRKLCGHCNEMLSYLAYRSHKDLYYDQSKQKWNTLGRTDNHVDSSVGDEAEPQNINVLDHEEDEEQNEMLESNMMDTSDFDFPADDSMQNSASDYVVEECAIYSDSSTSSEHEGIIMYA